MNAWKVQGPGLRGFYCNAAELAAEDAPFEALLFAHDVLIAFDIGLGEWWYFIGGGDYAELLDAIDNDQWFTALLGVAPEKKHTDGVGDHRHIWG